MDPSPTNQPSGERNVRGAASTWFWDHYEAAAGQIVDFLGGDGISLAGKVIADVGCGDGILDAGLAALARPARLVGFDIRPTDVEHLRTELLAEGVGDALPPCLEFRRCEAARLPADDGAFDHVVTWSAFEHIGDPVAVLGEIRRVLRPGGVLMLQLWPFFDSQHGSHLMDWFPEGFVHLLAPTGDVEAHVRGIVPPSPELDVMLGEYRSLNRITADELQSCLLAAGFSIAKFELLTGAVHIPPSLARYPLSRLGIAGIKLLAFPVR
jgi:SAM-dependent methyltransferase